MFIINPYRFSTGAAPDAAISLTDTASDAGNLTTYTFAAQSLGDAALDRFIVVGMGTRDAAQTVSSVTIGGVSASLIARQESSFNSAELWGASVPSGTTGDIVVTWSSPTNRCAISVYRLSNLTSTTPTDTAGSTDDPLSASIDVEAGGVVLAFSFGATNTTNTWTGLTEDVDDIVESQTYSSASAAFSTEQTGLSVTCDGAIAYAAPAMAVAAFR